MPRAPVFDRIWRDEGAGRFGGVIFWNSTLAYNDAEAAAFAAMPAPRTSSVTGQFAAGIRVMSCRTVKPVIGPGKRLNGRLPGQD